MKPANVLIGRDPDGAEHAYLTDFGLTRQPDQTTGLTGTGQFMGSVDYAAPEQFEGKPLDARTDVYSLACVAYQCLTGQVPFPREQEAAVMFAHLKTERHRRQRRGGLGDGSPWVRTGVEIRSRLGPPRGPRILRPLPPGLLLM